MIPAATDGERVAPSGQGTRTGRSVVVLAQVAIAVAILLAATPSLPAHWASATHFPQLRSGGSGETGFVTIDTCRRGSLVANWTCTGTFAVNDPMAEPYGPTPNVRLANDWRWHRAGSRLDAVIAVHGHVGYRWGGRVQAEVVLYWMGVLLTFGALVVSSVGLARRSGPKVVTWIALGAGGVLVGIFGHF